MNDLPLDSKKSKDKETKDGKGNVKKSQTKLVPEDKVEKPTTKPAVDELRSPIQAPASVVEGSVVGGEMEGTVEAEKSVGTTPAEETNGTLWMDFDDFCQCFR